MKKDEFLKIVSKEIHFFLDREKISEELENHLEDSILDLMEEGFSKEEAEKQAVLQMGNPVEIGKSLNHEHYPLIGYLWLGTTILVLFWCISLIPLCFYTISNIGSFLLDGPYWGAACEVSYDVNEEIIMDSYRVELLKICPDRSNSDYYTLFYRAWYTNPFKRVQQSFGIKLIGSDGFDYTGSGGRTHSWLGIEGNVGFPIPSGSKMTLIFSDNQEIVLDLSGVISDEKK